MGVDSLLEMYTIFWGWSQYKVMWELLKHTGLAYLPFFGLIVNSIIATSQSQDPGDASTASVRGIEIDFVTALVVILLAVEPSVPLKTNHVEYIKICFQDQSSAGNHQNKTYKRTNNTEDKNNLYSRISMQGFETVEIPAWWYAVMAFSNGVVRAGQKAMPCIDDIRTDVNKIQSNRFLDEKLQQNLSEFTKACYQKAKRLHGYYLRHGFPEYSTSENNVYKHTTTIAKFLYRGIDTEWMGSITFNRIQGFYRHMPVRADDYASEDFNFPTTCKEIWGEKNNGLRSRLLFELNKDAPGVVDRMLKKIDKRIHSGHFSLPHSVTEEDKKDYAIFLLLKTSLGRVLIYDNPSNAIKSGKYSNAISDAWNEASLTIGVPYQKIKHFSMIDTLIKTLPITGALMIMAVIVFLPFGLVFSTYSLKFLVVASIGMFSLKFFYYLWHISWWIDQNLLQLLVLEQLHTKEDRSADFVEIVGSMMYIGFPILWGLVVTWAGISINQFIGSASSESAAKPAYEGGNQVFDRASQKALSKILTQATQSSSSSDGNNKNSERNLDAKEKQKEIDELKKDKETTELASDELKDNLASVTTERDRFEQELEQASEENERIRSENDILKSQIAKFTTIPDDDFYYPIEDSKENKT